MGESWEAAARTARALAGEAGILAANMQAGVTSRDKGGDLGPVTDADVAVEALIVRGLREAFPTIPILAEESAPELAPKPPTTLWCIDPIDGTREYVGQLPEFAVQIGLLHDGVPVAGAFCLPALGVTYWGFRGAGAWCDETPIVFAPLPPLRESTMVHTRSRAGDRLERAVAAIAPAHVITAGGVGYKVSRVLEGEAHYYLHTGGGTTWWDTVGPAAVVMAAGGDACDTTGAPLSYRRDKHHREGLLFGGPGAVASVARALTK